MDNFFTQKKIILIFQVFFLECGLLFSQNTKVSLLDFFCECELYFHIKFKNPYSSCLFTSRRHVIFPQTKNYPTFGCHPH